MHKLIPKMIPKREKIESGPGQKFNAETGEEIFE